MYICLSKIYRRGFQPAWISRVGTTFANHLYLQIIIFPVKIPPVPEDWSWILWGQGVILTGGMTFRAPKCIVETTFAKRLSLWNAISPVKMPPIHKVLSWSLPGQGGHPDHRSTLPVPLTLPHNHYTQTSCLVGILGWKHSRKRLNRHKLPMKRSLPDIFLTILMESDPSHHPSLHCPHCEDDFCLLQCLILTFLARDMLSLRIKTAILVMVAARYGPLRGQKASKWYKLFPPGTITFYSVSFGPSRPEICCRKGSKQQFWWQ